MQETKKLLLLLMVLSSTFLFSQGRRDGQSSIQAEFGYMPTTQNKYSGAYMAKIGYSRVLGEKGFMLKGDFFYQDYEVDYLDNQILPYQKFGLTANVGYSYERLYPFFFNAWLGGYGGYENVNNAKQHDNLYNNKIPTKVEGFIYGLTGSAEVEVNVTNKLSLLFNYTQYYDLKSKFSESNYGLFGGLKFRIN